MVPTTRVVDPTTTGLPGGLPMRLLCVATSGGRDSTALLHAASRAARDLGLHVVALHVHHGLLAQADEWVTRLSAQCRRWAKSGLPVSLEVKRLSGGPQPGDSVEAWARRGRYAALAQMAQGRGASLVLLAHHQSDQAETFLLQALRVGSPAGLSAMPQLALRDGITWARPWLQVPRSQIDAYLRRHRLSSIEDPSNADTRFARNRVRLSVMPALESAHPGAAKQLAAAAERQQEAAACLLELAHLDALACVSTAATTATATASTTASTTDSGPLRVGAWLALSAARRAHVLRHWLQPQLPDGVPETLVRRLCEELPASRSGARWPAGRGWLLRRSMSLQFDAFAQGSGAQDSAAD